MSDSSHPSYSGDLTFPVPSGHSITLGPRFGNLALAIDLEYADKSEAEREWRNIEMLARRVKAIDGKPVGGYTRTRLLTDFLERDLAVIARVAGEMDTPSPEEYAAALHGAGLASKEAMDEAVALYRLTGGAIPFEQAMEMDEKRRKLLLAALLPKESDSSSLSP